MSGPVRLVSNLVSKKNIGYSASESSDWIRPADWLTLPVVIATDQKFVGLHAVYEESNFVALTASGAYTVNWGDGTVENFSAGVNAYHQYSYTNLTLNGTECSRGYKQAIVTVTPQAGQNLTIFNLDVKHNQAGLSSYTAGWLDIAVGSSYFSDRYPLIGAYGGNSQNIKKSLLEKVKIVNFGTATLFSYKCFAMISLQSIEFPENFIFTGSLDGFYYGCSNLKKGPAMNLTNVTKTAYMFSGCKGLKSIPLYNTGSVTDMSGMFESCYGITAVPLLNTQNVTTMASMFNSCESLQTVPLFNTVKVTTMSSMFNGCISLQNIPLFNTTVTANMTIMFSYCYSLQYVPELNGAAVASASTMTSMFNNCPALGKMKMLGIRFTFSLANCKLSQAALNEVYTNLPTVTGQTLTVTGNWGAALSNTSIALAKGWTVVT